MISENQPIEISLVTRMLSVSIEPACSRCWSAENCSSSAFWMITESPNVARIGASPLSSV